MKLITAVLVPISSGLYFMGGVGGEETIWVVLRIFKCLKPFYLAFTL